MIFKKKEGLPPHLRNAADKKTILLIIINVLLVISIILTNLNIFTGKIIKEEGIAQEQIIKEPTTQITVSPDPLKRGLYMTITLKAGTTGTDEIVSIQNEKGVKVVDNLNMGCNGPTCFNETIIKIYKSSTGWEPGKYKVVAKDDATSPETEVETFFTVTE